MRITRKLQRLVETKIRHAFMTDRIHLEQSDPSRHSPRKDAERSDGEAPAAK